MSADLDIAGTQLPIRFHVDVTSTVLHLKESIFRLPVARQTLSIAGAVMADGATLASYDITPDTKNTVDLAVVPNAGDRIAVTLNLPHAPLWIVTFRCKETDTVADFKKLVARKIFRVGTDGIMLFHGPDRTRMDRDDDRLIGEYLVLDGSVVVVEIQSVRNDGVKICGPFRCTDPSGHPRPPAATAATTEGTTMVFPFPIDREIRGPPEGSRPPRQSGPPN